MKNHFMLLFLFIGSWSFSQEQLGLRLENYAGVSSISLNPTGNLGNPLPWDLNLAAGQFFFENNYFFIKNTSSFDLLKNREDLNFDFAEDVRGSIRSNVRIVDFLDDGRDRFFSVNAKITGPSLVFKLNANHSVGFFTNARVVGGISHIPNEFSYFKYDDRPLNDPFNAPPFEGAVIVFREIGLNYALRVPTYTGYLGFGINFKRLHGYEAAYLENLQVWEHTKLPDNIIAVSNGAGRYGITNSNLKEDNFEQIVNGSGFAFDLGFVKVIQEYEDGYRWRLGVSLLDVGRIRFDKNAQAHDTRNPGTFHLRLDDYEQFDKIDEIEALFRYFSNDALQDSLASLEANQFNLALPAALSLQADYSFTNNLFLNTFFIHQFPTTEVKPPRGTLLALTPRYEHRWFSVSLPLSVYNWQEVRLGFAARLGFLVMGSDKIGSLIGKQDFTGTDIYFALKLNYVDLGLGLFNGLGKGGGKRKFGNKKKAKCFY